MSAGGFRIEVTDASLLAALRALSAAISDPSAIMADIAAVGESSTRLRFRTQTGPDGKPWKPSLRAQITGGRTLTEAGHLAASISSRSGRDWAEWGANRIYAAIHQFGGVIRARNAKALRFALAGGGFATVKSVTLPARPFLGLSTDDVADIVHIIETRLAAAAA
ncbi:MAG TPA: phage virion morphogenesis protein [Caulobacter sp.]|nr:phage virion morphogenesis protein [Caulobacter sp.]